VLNKIDLIDLVDFERARFYESVRALNPQAPIFEVSCRTGAGVEAWAEWLRAQAPAPGVETVTHTHTNTKGRWPA